MGELSVELFVYSGKSFLTSVPLPELLGIDVEGSMRFTRTRRTRRLGTFSCFYNAKKKHSVSTIHRHLTEYNTSRSLMCAHRLHVDSSFLGFDAFPSAPRPSATRTSPPDKLNRGHSLILLDVRGSLLFLFFLCTYHESVWVPRWGVVSLERGGRR